MREAAPEEALRALIDWHVTFALEHKALIVVQDRDWAALPLEAREKVRETQRKYVEVWVKQLRAIRPELSAGDGPGERARRVRAAELHTAQRLVPRRGDARPARGWPRWRCSSTDRADRSQSRLTASSYAATAASARPCPSGASSASASTCGARGRRLLTLPSARRRGAGAEGGHLGQQRPRGSGRAAGAARRDRGRPATPIW